jgi:LysR family transcriptional regulator AphB/LysR family L-lactate utilization transcriptional regulator
MEGRTMHMLYPHRESLPVKTRAFIEFVMDKVAHMEAGMAE